jgi:hypothetical protein
MMMLVGTDAGDAYTQRELEKMLANAGFPNTERHPMPGGVESVLVSS